MMVFTKRFRLDVALSAVRLARHYFSCLHLTFVFVIVYLEYPFLIKH